MVEAHISDSSIEHWTRGLSLMKRRNWQPNPLAIVAMVSLPLAVVLEIGTIDLGHELTWFHRLSETEGGWLRVAVLSVAIASTFSAIAHSRISRFHR
jgi:hypothetical protein